MQNVDGPDPAAEDTVQAAFRAGVQGAPVGVAAFGLAEDQAAFVAETAPPMGVSVAHVARSVRMAGLTDAEGAYGTGRVLRRLAQLLDQVGAPGSVMRQFQDNLAGAVVIHRMRAGKRAWSEDDTVQMVLEMWDRIFGERDAVRARLSDLLTADDGRRRQVEKRSMFRLAWKR